MAPCAFLLGFLSVVAQVILIRELMSVYSGNELVFVVVLGVWLLGVALGSVWLRFSSWGLVLGLFVLAVILLPATIVGIRFLRPWLGISPGSLIDIGRVAMGSAALVLPLAVMMGGVFTLLARLREDAVFVYGYEAMGFTWGGMLMAFIFLTPLPAALDQWSRMVSWPGYQLIADEQTHYGSLMIVERAGQRSLFENGRHLFTGDDVLAAEEVHLPLLLHPSPKAVFLMGGGFTQAGAQALKHPLERLDYAELDPAALRLERDFFVSGHDVRLHLKAGDPRRVLAQQAQRYDVIIVNVGDPVSLLSARLFTREFFNETRRHLLPGGVLAVTMGLSEDYVNAQGKAYASTIYATLAFVFKDVQFVPGERMVWLASDMKYPLTSDFLVARLKERKIMTKFIQGYYLKDRMALQRMDGVRTWIDPAAPLSTDDKPIVAVRALSFLTTRTGLGFSACVAGFERWGGWLWGLIPVMALGLFFHRRKEDMALWGMGLAGFTQMAFQVTVILGVQAVFGYAYAVVGVLTAGFMLGAYMGTRLSGRLPTGDVMAIGVLAQVLLAGVFLGCWLWWTPGLFIIPVISGVAGGVLFSVYAGMVGHERLGGIYAADLIGAALGVLVVGLLGVPLWGITVTMVFVVMVNAVLLLGCKKESAIVRA